jgi:predicted GNAT family acetyltransferase
MTSACKGAKTGIRLFPLPYRARVIYALNPVGRHVCDCTEAVDDRCDWKSTWVSCGRQRGRVDYTDLWLHAKATRYVATLCARAIPFPRDHHHEQMDDWDESRARTQALVSPQWEFAQNYLACSLRTVMMVTKVVKATMACFSLLEI